MLWKKNNKKRGKGPIPSDILWNTSKLHGTFRNPSLFMIDIRDSGVFRGGPPSTNEVATKYHQGHFFLSVNLNLSGATTVEQVQEEIESGRNSAGGSFLDTIVFAIISDFDFLFYDQDGSNLSTFELLKKVQINYGNDNHQFPQNRIHWLEGGYNAIQKSCLREFCYDTKTLLGQEEYLEESEYSEVLPHLFVGGAVCSPEQYDELRKRDVTHVLNVSNIDKAPEGFDYDFIYADDVETEQLTRLFERSSEIIDIEQQKGKGVLVHCQRGLSRSPTLVIAYLMMKKRMCLRQAYEMVRKARPNIGPRSNFMVQLCHLESVLREEGPLEGFAPGSNMPCSLPMQVYELSSMRCIKYEDGIALLSGDSPKTDDCCIM